MTAILGLLPLLVLNMHGTEIERPLAIVMIGGLVTSTLFTLLALPTFYLFVHDLGERWRTAPQSRVMAHDADRSCLRADTCEPQCGDVWSRVVAKTRFALVSGSRFAPNASAWGCECLPGARREANNVGELRHGHHSSNQIRAAGTLSLDDPQPDQ